MQMQPRGYCHDVNEC